VYIYGTFKKYLKKKLIRHQCKDQLEMNELGCNTFVPGSNVRHLSVKLFLSQPAKTLCPSYYAYVFSSTKLEIREEQGKRRRMGGEGGDVGEGEEMTRTMYAHVNK
jgi:hypothetical protein